MQTQERTDLVGYRENIGGPLKLLDGHECLGSCFFYTLMEH
jgi:hypothetical protein